jgi:transcriptional regulator with XRE-family HTH domain
MKLSEYRQELAQDPAYLAAEQDLRPLFDLADAVIALRLERGWSQAELAERTGTKQANISRLESGLANPSVKFLQKLANALGESLTIRLQPDPTPAPRASVKRTDRLVGHRYPQTSQQALPAIHDNQVEWLVTPDELSQPGSESG